MSIYDNAGVVLIPSGYKAGTTDNLYSILPANGDGDFNATRGSTATRVNKDGFIESVATNVPRLDYPLIDGVVQDCPALLLEPQRTNDIERTEEFDNAYWGKSNGTVTANQTISPDGSQNADRFAENTSTASHLISRSGISIASGVSHTLSVFAKANGRNTFRLFKDDGSGAFAFFNLNSGSIGTTSSATAKMVNYGNGWYRCSITFTSTSTSIYVQFLLSQDNETTSYLGDGSSGMYFWGAQLEEGSYPTSYISWDGSGTTTRSADVCNGSGTSAEFNDTESSLFVEIQGLAEDNTNRYIVINDGAGSPYTNSSVIQYRNNGTVRVFHNGLDFEDAIHVSGASFDQTENHKIAVRFKENDMKVYIDGVSQSLNSSFVYQSISGLDEFSFDLNGALPFLGRVKQAMTFKTALTDSELETLTSWDSFNAMAKGQLYTIE
jgi:hypothetical protein